jgi:hypothetical protein
MKLITVFFIIFFIFLASNSQAFAIYDPLSKPNNIFGIHVLFPSEIHEAKNLINSTSGDWGYVTIPIQSSDKDLQKWQSFMDDAKRLHVIPIIRLSTTGDYFNTAVWEKPKLTDIVDFANFLDSLDWPTENRYIVVYNEVNRGDEWGGSPDPFEYAQILDYAVDVFKTKNPDFFVISAGLDNAAPNIFRQYMNAIDFMNAMSYEVPNIFTKIDGLSSHSYPNPAFSQPPNGQGVSSFKRERDFAEKLGGKKLPVFITETGWSNETLPEDLIASYYRRAFENVWNDPGIVAVTPFILNAGAGDFAKFSFMSKNGDKTPYFKELQKFPKTQGQPNLAKIKEKIPEKKVSLPSKTFDLKRKETDFPTRLKKVGIIFKWLLNI